MSVDEVIGDEVSDVVVREHLEHVEFVGGAETFKEVHEGTRERIVAAWLMRARSWHSCTVEEHNMAKPV